MRVLRGIEFLKNDDINANASSQTAQKVGGGGPPNSSATGGSATWSQNSSDKRSPARARGVISSSANTSNTRPGVRRSDVGQSGVSKKTPPSKSASLRVSTKVESFVETLNEVDLLRMEKVLGMLLVDLVPGDMTKDERECMVFGSKRDDVVSEGKRLLSGEGFRREAGGKEREARNKGSRSQKGRNERKGGGRGSEEEDDPPPDDSLWEKVHHQYLSSGGPLRRCRGNVDAYDFQHVDLFLKTFLPTDFDPYRGTLRGQTEFTDLEVRDIRKKYCAQLDLEQTQSGEVAGRPVDELGGLGCEAVLAVLRGCGCERATEQDARAVIGVLNRGTGAGAGTSETPPGDGTGGEGESSPIGRGSAPSPTSPQISFEDLLEKVRGRAFGISAEQSRRERGEEWEEEQKKKQDKEQDKAPASAEEGGQPNKSVLSPPPAAPAELLRLEQQEEETRQLLLLLKQEDQEEDRSRKEQEEQQDLSGKERDEQQQDLSGKEHAEESVKEQDQSAKEHVEEPKEEQEEIQELSALPLPPSSQELLEMEEGEGQSKTHRTE